MAVQETTSIDEVRQNILKALLFRGDEFEGTITCAPQRHGDRIYITDARLLVDLPFCDSMRKGSIWFIEKSSDSWIFGHDPTDAELSCLKENRRPFPKLKEFFSEVPKLVSISIPTIETPARIKSWDWMGKSSCRECRGFGSVECNYGHDHDCDDCDGTGIVLQQLDEADERISVSIEGKVFDFGKWYLWLINQFPNPRGIGWLQQENGSAYLFFEFDGGRGVLAGLIPEDERYAN